MITAEERQHFEALRAQVPCPKKYLCIESALTDLCQGKYHRDIDVLECLEKSQPPCQFAREFGSRLVCTCPLRQYIAQNFDRWTAEDTALVRPKP